MKTFNSIVTEFFKIPESSITDSLTPKDIPDWDSMNYLLFIAELEQQFDITFAMDEVLSLESIGGVTQLLISKGVSI